MQIFFDIVKHPDLGTIFVYWDDGGRLKEVGLIPSHLDVMSIPRDLGADLPEIKEFLQNFTYIDKPNFGIDKLDLDDFTPFSQKVYQTLFDVPKGVKVTYGELAAMSGFAGAHRAVGTTMRKNRFLLVIPCHRVVGANSLGGFTTGMSTKIKLLELEGIEHNA